MCSGCLFLALLLRCFLHLLGIYCFPIGSIREGPRVAGSFAAGAREGAGSETRARPTDKNKSDYIGKGQGEQRGVSAWLFLRKITVMQEKWVYVVALPSERKEPPAPECLGAVPRAQISSCIDVCDFNSPKYVWACLFFNEFEGCPFSDSGERHRQGEGQVQAIPGGRTEEDPRPGEPPAKRDRGQWHTREVKQNGSRLE